MQPSIGAGNVLVEAEKGTKVVILITVGISVLDAVVAVVLFDVVVVVALLSSVELSSVFTVGELIICI